VELTNKINSAKVVLSQLVTKYSLNETIIYYEYLDISNHKRGTACCYPTIC